MSRESATSLYRRSLLPADRANLPVASLVDCLPPALALRNRQGLQERGSSSGSSSSRAFQRKKDVTRGTHATTLQSRACKWWWQQLRRPWSITCRLPQPEQGGGGAAQLRQGRQLVRPHQLTQLSRLT